MWENMIVRSYGGKSTTSRVVLIILKQHEPPRMKHCSGCWHGRNSQFLHSRFLKLALWPGIQNLLKKIFFIQGSEEPSIFQKNYLIIFLENREFHGTWHKTFEIFFQNVVTTLAFTGPNLLTRTSDLMVHRQNFMYDGNDSLWREFDSRQNFILAVWKYQPKTSEVWPDLRFRGPPFILLNGLLSLAVALQSW